MEGGGLQLRWPAKTVLSLAEEEGDERKRRAAAFHGRANSNSFEPVKVYGEYPVYGG